MPAEPGCSGRARGTLLMLAALPKQHVSLPYHCRKRFLGCRFRIKPSYLPRLKKKKKKGPMLGVPPTALPLGVPSL